jgi:hypothetical protein
MTFLYKYLFTPIWGAGFLFGIIATWTNDDVFSYNWSRGAAVMVAWAMIWLTILMIRLRNVEATSTKLVVKKLTGQEAIEYNDIEYVSQIAMISPTLISIKYKNRRTGESRKILVIPSTSSQMFKFNFLDELEMTKFIRTQVVKANPNYNTGAEPSRWLTFGLIMLTSLPIILIVNIFFVNF